MNKLDSIWYHEGAPGSSELASSHIAVLFCALVVSNMITEDLLGMEFEGIPNTFNNESLSPMDYLIAYTDGELYDIYIKPKYRTAITTLFSGDDMVKLLDGSLIDGLEYDTRCKTYSLKCNWHNVHVIADLLHQHYY